MGKLSYLVTKLHYILRGRDHEVMNNYFRKKGATVGSRTHIYSDISAAEPFLIQIGNDVTISNGACLITHDASVKKFLPGKTDVFGKIVIGNNCFIGMNAILLPGVTVADNCIVAAGSVVTRSVTTPGTVVGGNPAKPISTVETLKEKYIAYAVDLEQVATDKKSFILSAPHITR